MEIEQKIKKNNNENNYHIENLKIAREFSKELLLEMKDLVRSIVLFGSNNNDTLSKNSDIDLMIVLDNVSLYVGDELREAYKIITKKIASKFPEDKLHIMSINLSDLWDMARKADPVLVNILRYGLALFDRDLISPLQYLLEIGKIRPTRETAYNYISRAQTLMNDTSKHLENSILDMYYSVIDIVHATLITQKIMPPSPKDMPEIFKKTFAKNPIGKYSKDIKEFYKLAKDIEHSKLKVIDGNLYDKYYKIATNLVNDLTKFSKQEIENKDTFEL